MQGPSLSGRKSGGRFIVSLAAAHVVAASLTVFVLASAAPLIAHTLPHRLILSALAIGSVVGIVADVRAVKNRRLSLGLSRQTPKVLLRLGNDAWIAPLIWGFDTGLIWSTFRVSFSSWILLLMALAGVTPPWAGAVYGVAFAIPLLGGVFLSPRHLLARRLVSPIPAQLFGIASIGVIVILTATLLIGRR